ESDRNFKFQREFGSYVMENILFKLSFPAEFHSQTACEAAVQLHPIVKDRLGEIESIEISTHDSAIRIISKHGPLANPADRDHCLQYMVAVPLITGNLVAENYEDDFHRGNPMIDRLREKMNVVEEPQYSADYHDPEKRSIANALRIVFKDGTATDRIEIEYPIGHRRRRTDGMPVLEAKFERAVTGLFDGEKGKKILQLFSNESQLLGCGVNELCGLIAK
ncbi:2-methylcitrate dehydratase, partial [Pirellulaceae bacterium]|nr:2-methylcitrate dehydratase [Pirellulaceae bacterium]